MDKIIYSSFAAERKNDLRICTQILERDGKRAVRKSAIDEDGFAHIEQIRKNEKILKDRFSGSKFFSVCPISASGEGWVEFAYQKGRTLENWIEEELQAGHIESVQKILTEYWRELLSMAQGTFTADAAFSEIFGETLPKKSELHSVTNMDVDLIFTNLFFSTKQPKKLTVTDYEWVCTFAVPLEYIYYRAVFCSVAISRLPEEQKTALYGIAGIREEDLPVFLQMEIAFQKSIIGTTLPMNAHAQRLRQRTYQLTRGRAPYELVIIEGENGDPQVQQTNEYRKQLDLSGTFSDILRVRMGYPFSIVTLDPDCAENWECENQDWEHDRHYMAGVVPLLFRWKQTGEKKIGYTIEDEDGFAYQDTTRSRILAYMDVRKSLEDQVNTGRAENVLLSEQLNNSQAENVSLNEQLNSSREENASLNEQLNNSQAENVSLNEQLNSSREENASLNEQLNNSQAENVSLNEQLNSSREENASLNEQLNNCESENALLNERLKTDEEKIAVLEDHLNAYKVEWELMNTEGKLKHMEPVALIRGKQARRQEEQAKNHMNPDATIVIPTKNGGELFKQVLDRVYGQVTQYTYEVICVDSGSTDQTLQIIQDSPAKLIQIPPEEFGHGKTRNLGASKGTGEFICFLTQDALPVHESWLENMLNAMKMDPDIAGGFGRHLPYPGCNFIDERDINGLFDGFGHTDTLYWNEDQNRYDNDPGYRSVLAFFSDNNSCLRRSVWEQYPYPDVEFAEDQIWMRQMIEKGYKKVYCPEATVYHSHNYDPSTYFMRYYDEHKGLYEIHGYINLKHWYYVPAAMTKHVIGDWRYIRSTPNRKKTKLGMLWYSVRRNYARYTGGYIGGHFHLKDDKTKAKLDRKYSQQYRQRRGIYGKSK